MAIKGNNKAMQPTDAGVKTKAPAKRVFIVKGVRILAVDLDDAYKQYYKDNK